MTEIIINESEGDGQEVVDQPGENQEVTAPIIEEAMGVGAAAAIASIAANEAGDSAEQARIAAEDARLATETATENLRAELSECQSIIATMTDQMAQMQAQMETMRSLIPAPSPEIQQNLPLESVEKTQASPEDQGQAPEPERPKRKRPRWI